MSWLERKEEYNTGDLVRFTKKMYDKALVNSYGLYFGMSNTPYGYYNIYSFKQKRMRRNILLGEFDKVKGG